MRSLGTPLHRPMAALGMLSRAKSTNAKGGNMVRSMVCLLFDHQSARIVRTPPAQPALSSFSHRGSKRNSDQQSFWSDETADRLAPRFLFVLYEHSMPLRFKFPSCLFDIFNVKLKPSVWRRNFSRPRILTKA